MFVMMTLMSRLINNRMALMLSRNIEQQFRIKNYSKQSAPLKWKLQIYLYYNSSFLKVLILNRYFQLFNHLCLTLISSINKSFFETYNLTYLPSTQHSSNSTRRTFHRSSSNSITKSLRSKVSQLFQSPCSTNNFHSPQ